MVLWKLKNHNAKLIKENESLKQQLSDLRGEKTTLQKLLNATREELARTRLHLQDQIEDLQDQVDNYSYNNNNNNKNNTTMKMQLEKEQQEQQGLSKDHNNDDDGDDDGSVGGILELEQPSASLPEQETQPQGTQPQNRWTKETTGSLLQGLRNNESILQEAELFESTIIDGIPIDDDNYHGVVVQMLRRTKAVSILGQHMMEVESEQELYEEVSRLIVALFQVDRCSYSIFVDTDCMVVVKASVTESGFQLALPSGTKVELAGTAIGKVKETGRPIYSPDVLITSSSQPTAECQTFQDQKMIATMGLHTTMIAPIFLNNPNHPYATLNVAIKDKDGLTAYDQLLLAELARMLGKSIYLQRLKEAERERLKISQDLLYSLCPEPVIKRIQHHWETNNDSTTNLQEEETYHLGGGRGKEEEESKDNAAADHSHHHHGIIETKGMHRRTSINNLIKKVASATTRNGDDSTQPFGLVRHDSIFSNNTNDSPTHALYAEDVYDVCIIFADIVGFSKISQKISPMEVMDMLQTLFSKFDALCQRHRVLKLETIGDAFLGSTGLLEEEDESHEDLAVTAPQRALAFAKDVVLAANTVSVPIPADELLDEGISETVSVRVGVHCGDATCGVLGQNLPKFAVFGHTINLAARMEQSCWTDRVHVTDEFFQLIKDDENMEDWEGPRTVSVKNMRAVESWHCNPTYEL